MLEPGDEQESSRRNVPEKVYTIPEQRRPPSGPPRNPSKRTSEKAVFALLLGIAGIAMWIITALPAIILGFLARGEINKDENLTGKGIATLGILLGFAGLFLAPTFVILLFVAGNLGGGGGSFSSDTERVVHIHLSGGFSEKQSTNPFDAFTGSVGPLLGEFLHVLNTAAEDEAVLAVVITVDMFFPEAAHNEEIYNALQALVESGTDVYIHNEEAVLTTSQYGMLSAATHFNAVPTAYLDLVGFYGEGMYLRDGLKSIGVEADFVHIGDYKSAGEMMTRNEPSPAASEGMRWLYDSLYESRVNMIAESRNMDPMDVRTAIDSGPYTAEEAEKAGLVDSVMYQDELMDLIHERYGEDILIDEDYGSYSNQPYGGRSAWLQSGGADGTVGLVVLEGTIMPGYSNIGATSGMLRWALDAAAESDEIDAVVLRVNSPGGSVTASEVILRAVENVKSEKPIVVSMGSVAASGGYYVACKADRIYADEMTITGSIGVVSGKIVTAELWEELGINWYPIQRGENADWSSSSSKFSEAQREQITQSMTAAYDVFKNHVIEGRGDRLTADLETMAGGRVFTGVQAKELGLVDEIGGLRDAIAHAAELADIEDYSVRMIPRQMELSELIQQAFFGGPEPANPSDLGVLPQQTIAPEIQVLMRERLAARSVSPTVALLSELEPQRAREFQRWLEFATLIKREGVVAISPQLPVNY